MKKGNFVLMVIAVIVITALSSSARDSVAQSEQAVDCSCSAWNGHGCRADYWGATCAPGSDCVSYDRNCSKPLSPTP